MMAIDNTKREREFFKQQQNEKKRMFKSVDYQQMDNKE